MNKKPLLAANPGIFASIVASPALIGVTTPSSLILTFSEPLETDHVGKNLDPSLYFVKTSE